MVAVLAQGLRAAGQTPKQMMIQGSLHFMTGPRRGATVSSEDGTRLLAITSSHGNQNKRMNKLTKLFSPRALAATAASAILVHAAVLALADGCYSQSAVPLGSGTQCVQECRGLFFDGWRYWCCAAIGVDNCGGVASYYPPTAGWCCPVQ